MDQSGSDRGMDRLDLTLSGSRVGVSQQAKGFWAGLGIQIPAPPRPAPAMPHRL